MARYKNLTHPTGNTPKFKFVTFSQDTYVYDSVQFPTSSGGDIIGPSTFGHSAPLSGASVGAVP